MKKLLALSALATLATAGAQSGFELGLTGGYAGGLSGEVFVHAPNVVGPVGLKAGVAYTKAADAILDSNGLIPFSQLKKSVADGGLGATEYGSHTVVSLDGTYGLGQVAPGVDTLVYGGPRYGMFTSTEDYGSNGRTVYSANAFGLGAGAMASYALTGTLSLVGDLGVDYFMKGAMNYTQYNGSGVAQPCAVGETNTNCVIEASDTELQPRFVRPGTTFKARIGVKYSF